MLLHFPCPKTYRELFIIEYCGSTRLLSNSLIRLVSAFAEHATRLSSLLSSFSLNYWGLLLWINNHVLVNEVGQPLQSQTRGFSSNISRKISLPPSVKQSEPVQFRLSCPYMTVHPKSCCHGLCHLVLLRVLFH
jgi:hypothetical protein